ncbi:putative competence-damage inducible protein [Pelotomaculum sp. FP]|uniref:CinA family nicotinamide mononucleotide deamidase-related protein n=1 Tax=Pelotomaculum sp. FP TaxID=261474 RepID=UPI001066E514|nr:CinA family nicotinamide mononucleotide deamidase-related protein [Pelotomaculum sp. FP]TEB16381.1 putative competence-damage inducible protein [Pelotomaculum sp. FP]
MIAEVIFSGTELLLGQILNINGQYIQQTLASMGIDSYHQLTVGDNRDRCAQAIRQAAARADLIFVGGGLGPTEDDVSREALSEALQIPLVQDETALNIVRRIYLARGITMPEVNMKQALIPVGGKALDNRVGVAPGIVLEHQGKVFFLLPGPPFEFNCMLDEQVVPYLKSRFPEEMGIIYSRVLKLCGIGESFLAQSLGDLFKSSYPTVFTCVKGSYIDLSITAKAEDELRARRDIAAMENILRQRIGQYIFGADRDTLPGVIGRELARRGKSVAVVEEECSGGLLTHMLSVDPLSARVFAGGVVLSKTPGLKGLSEGLSRPQGTTEAKAAEQLARAIRRLTGSGIGIAVLGPSQQEALVNNKNMMTVGIDLGHEILVKESLLWDNKSEVARRGAETALVRLWQVLQEIG